MWLLPPELIDVPVDVRVIDAMNPLKKAFNFQHLVYSVMQSSTFSFVNGVFNGFCLTK
jgi:hypothetical protein